MPPYPMMFQGGSPDETQQTGDPVSEQEALVRRLLSSLEPNQTPPPPQLSNSRRILGPLGDALMAMASVRAGGAPPQMGAFAAEQEKRRAAYEQRLTENARADRTLRNQVRIGLMKPAKPGVSWQQRMVNGTPHTFQVILDPQTGLPTNEIDFGERFVPPAVTPYINPMTGAAEVGRVSRTTGNVGPVTMGGRQVGAVPPQGVVTDVGKGKATLEGLDAVTQAYSDIRKTTNEQGPWGQYIRERAVQHVPGPASSYFPEYANYIATRQAALNAYIKSVTGAQFSVAELKRYENQFPEPWDPEDVASNKIEQLKQRAVADMQDKQKLYPSLGKSAPGGGSPNTRSWSGVVLHESDFTNAKPGERERFLAGGGRIAP